jgi:hypothetical protein
MSAFSFQPPRTQMGDEPKEGPVPEAVCLSLECFDLVVGSFQGSGRNPMIVVSEDTGSVGAQRLGNILEYADA